MVVVERTRRNGRKSCHLKSVILELHRFKPLQGLLAAAALLATALLKEVLGVWKFIIRAIG